MSSSQTVGSAHRVSISSFVAPLTMRTDSVHLLEEMTLVLVTRLSVLRRGNQGSLEEKGFIVSYSLEADSVTSLAPSCL